MARKKSAKRKPVKKKPVKKAKPAKKASARKLTSNSTKAAGKKTGIGSTKSEVSDLSLMSDGSKVEIHGVVSWSGGGLSQVSRQKDWNLSAEFSAWKFPGGSLESEPLVISKPGVSENYGSRLMKKFEPCQLKRISGLVRKVKKTGNVYVELKRDLGASADKELRAFVREYRKESTVVSSNFGKLKEHKGPGWFEGERTWDDQRYV
ncbi:MAG: hypothetical protein AAF456_25260 [Planctomycetota bacterium]